MSFFDGVVGNPPYQNATANTSDEPVYNYFVETSYNEKLTKHASLIHPARVLFSAGKTSNEFNQRLLANKHDRVVEYFPRSQEVFTTSDIKGGVAITEFDATKSIGPIGTYSPYPELNGILNKVRSSNGFQTLDDLIIQQNKWSLKNLYAEHPEYESKIGSNGTERRLTTGIFSAVDLFREQSKDGDLKILGVIKNQRVYRYIEAKYIDTRHENLNRYKALLPASNGSGALGEVVSTPLVGTPLVGYTQTFIGFGAFDSESEATACVAYLKTKFCRVLLGTRKVTQHNHKGTWINVPLQDFTSASDIDWSLSIPEIDAKLYDKYNLTATEIEFIESHVKAMT